MDLLNQEFFGSNFPKTASKTMLSIKNAVQQAINAQNCEENKKDESLKVISLEELMSHSTIDDCWIVVNDYVYDVTEYLMKHPPGFEVLFEEAGRDATSAFLSAGHSKSAVKSLDKYLIGELPVNERLFRKENGLKIGM